MIAILVSYKSENGAARGFAEEMESSGLAAQVRAEDGCIRYDYYVPLGDPDGLLLSEGWRDQAALDAHRDGAVMQKIKALRTEKYPLTMSAELYQPYTES